MKKKEKIIIGKFDGKNGGYGFLIPEDGSEDIFIPQHYASTALNGDIVSAIKIKEGSKYIGKVINVLRRGKEKYVGRIVIERGVPYLYVFDKNVPYLFYIENFNKKKFKKGDTVLARFTKWESRRYAPNCVILKKIEKDEIERYILEETFSLKDEFPKNVIEEAKRINFNIKEKVKDLRKEFVITIDPEDAKDFDDAISIRKIKGKYYLYVHIADVSSYVKKNTEIDKEAQRRGLTVYLPYKTFYMLPKELTDKISITENEDKKVITVTMKIDESGDVLDYSIDSAVVKNKKRLSYEEAEKLINSDHKTKLGKYLKELYELSKIIEKKKLRLKRLDFNIPKVEVRIIDEEIIIMPEKRLSSHDLIEEFMVLTNEMIANEQLKFERGIFRIHEEPDEIKLQEFKRFVGLLGYKLEGITREALFKFLEYIKGEPLEKILNYELLRCMKRARYVAYPSSHFALASQLYTHFTSPVRRYPDLVVHRIIKGEDYSLKELEKIAEHSTDMEWKAQEAERKAQELFVLKYLEKNRDKEFTGLIKGVSNKGVFVELEDFLISGFIPVSLLPEDNYRAFENELIGRWKKFRVGEKIITRINHLDTLSGELELEFIGRVIE
uniref:exoribonuclease II n=1 Tax=candidate division WOR-3 bacterium TaxID=2052148 RepID=A0A7C4UHH1_UNCW3